MVGFDTFFCVILGIAVFLGVLVFRNRRNARGKSIPQDSPALASTSLETATTTSGDVSSLYEIVQAIWPFYDQSAHPRDLRDSPDFIRGVTFLSQERFTPGDLAAYFSGDNAIIACLATEALSRRDDGAAATEDLLASIGTVAPWSFYFALNCLAATTPPGTPIVGRVLARGCGQLDNRMARSFLEEFVRKRMSDGEVIRFGKDFEELSETDIGDLRRFLEYLDDRVAGQLLATFRHWMEERIDRRLLESIGSVWNQRHIEQAQKNLDHDALDASVNELEANFLSPAPRSVLLVGESGVGKTAITDRLAARLYDQDWMIFEASHAELVAGQVFVGSLEQRMREMFCQLGGGRRILWLIRNFHLLAFTGVGERSPVGALDMMLPRIEQQEVKILAETQPAAYQRLLEHHPRVATVCSVLRIEPLSAAATTALAREWMRRWTSDAVEIEAVLKEAAQLAQQFLGQKAAPGNLLELLDLTRRRLTADAPDRPCRMTVDDLILTLAQLTGLPVSILDERKSLSVESLRAHFLARIFGQVEAVECLVERVAMIKAGVTDPSRPAGVFLFAGPTGTGKTEIAKTLAEWMFGSPERMIRLDMSELQTPESLDRLLGSLQARHADALVDRIRRQPFSVILLDEFEKAHPNVWDVFLQVFDDGRLTDRRGTTADFRHAIIILTSNLGGAITSGVSLGFESDRQGFDPLSVLQVVETTFRKEFINRLDRVIVFRPLNREQMREILKKELDAVFHRRGLRSREWAVEWDESAIDLLLEKGFTKDLGSRPLKRAVDRYLLSPLALTIVNHQVPAGEQFLFVTRERDALNVQFVDPDAPEAESDETERAPVQAVAIGEDRGLHAIALDPHGTPAEIAFLRDRYERLNSQIQGDRWQEDKAAALAMIGQPDFWDSPERFQILGRTEYQDRVDTMARRLGSLLDRLNGPGRPTREHYPKKLVGSVAHNLYLLETACADLEQGCPFEAFLLVEAETGAQPGSTPADAFAAELGCMYLTWARNRRMHVRVVEEARPDEHYRLLLAVSGFGAFSILEKEDGLHVLEVPDEQERFARLRTHVRIVPQEAGAEHRSKQALDANARDQLNQHKRERLRIVRRYRRVPSPLVRDSVRGWRTGRLDQVLGGEFDLLGPD
jgi:ATP-dependent Clp protease ATP-binding subunit ClpC